MRIKMFCNDQPSLYPYLYSMSFVNPYAYMNVHQCGINAQIQTLTNEINRGMLTANQIRQIENVKYYADNIPIVSVNENCITDVFRKPKNKLTIYDLDRLIFPFDPIRYWVEKKIKEINEKYAWAEVL